LDNSSSKCSQLNRFLLREESRKDTSPSLPPPPKKKDTSPNIWHYISNLRRECTPCSLGLSATSQQYFSLRTNQPPATSHNQPAVFFSQQRPAPAISCYFVMSLLPLDLDATIGFLHNRKYDASQYLEECGYGQIRLIAEFITILTTKGSYKKKWPQQKKKKCTVFEETCICLQSNTFFH
jgi:hypothetical protein